MIPATGELVLVGTAESDSGDTEFDTDASASTVIAAFKMGDFIESTANLSLSNNAESDSGTNAASVIPVSEPEATIESTANCSLPAPCKNSEHSPLTFHNVHCRGIRVSADGSVATRLDAECGTVYSARPVNIYEKICLRFLEVNTSSRITAGFTNCDPTTSNTSSTSKWSHCLAANVCTKGTVIRYYVNAFGDVHFEINGVYSGISIRGVDTSNPLWMRLYINKFGTEVELLDPRKHAKGKITDSLLKDKGIISKNKLLNVDDLPMPFPSVTLPLHKNKGTNVLTNQFGEAAKLYPEINHGYVFIADPIKLSFTMYIQILQTETAYSGSLVIGVTNLNPEYLKTSDLPESPRLLLRRPGYWAVASDVASGMKRGDYLEVTLMTRGEVKVGRNGSPPEMLMQVNNSRPIWIFVNIYGATQKIRFLYRVNSLAPHTGPDECTLWPPPLTFHSDPDMKDIRVSNDGFKVISVDTKCGSVYSARPVNINEKVSLCFLEVNGFDPKFLAGFMNRCPMSLTTDFTWVSVESWKSHVKAAFCTKGIILSYSVDSDGVVRFYINGKFEGIFIKEVDTSNPLWVYLNISQTETAVQFLGPRKFAQVKSMAHRRTLRIMPSNVNALVVDNCPTPFRSKTLPLHKTKSSNVETNEFGEAARLDSEIDHGYVFTAQPIQISSTMYIQILQTEKAYSRSLAIGVTSCNPENLTLSDLPEDPELLSQRPEEWEIITDVANDIKRGDYLEVTLRANGDFEVGRNGSRPLTHMFVNNISPLWLFVNMYGATQKIRLLSRLNTFVFERPPRLKFHKEQHDKGIRIHEDCFTVVKLFISDHGRAYSARPVEVNEKICLRFLELYRNPRIFICFVSKSKCSAKKFDPNKNWTKMLEPEICTIGTTFSYYFDTAGVVHFEINGEYKGNWIDRVDPKESHWACIDIESRGVVMRLVNPTNLVPNQSIMSIDESPFPIRSNLIPLNLHKMKSFTVQTNKNGEAETWNNKCHGYVFTAQPIELERTIFIQILKTETAYTRSLAIGLTSREPGNLNPNDLPEDSNLLHSNPEYLVIQNNKTMSDIKQGDELALNLTTNGEVQLSRNGEPVQTLQQVEHSVPLWVFVNLYKATRKVRLLTQLPAGNPPPQPSVTGLPPTRTTIPSLAASENTTPLRIDCIRSDPSTGVAQDVTKDEQLLVAGGTSIVTECIVCKEVPVNCVLYRCGHMMMCLKCARKEWRGDISGRCPTCREQTNVI